MADTVNFIRSASATTLAEAGAAWTVVLTGALTTSSLMECRAGELEYVEAASAPAVTLRGHLLQERESQNIASLGSGQAIYARATSSKGADLIVTPGA